MSHVTEHSPVLFHNYVQTVMCMWLYWYKDWILMSIYIRLLVTEHNSNEIVALCDKDSRDEQRLHTVLE
jgi:hypothetical protein